MKKTIGEEAIEWAEKYWLIDKFYKGEIDLSNSEDTNYNDFRQIFIKKINDSISDRLFPENFQVEENSPEEPQLEVQKVRLIDLPAGSLFKHNGTLALKSEYINVNGAVEAYIVGSGEIFWGGTSSPATQRNLLVEPVNM